MSHGVIVGFTARRVRVNRIFSLSDFQITTAFCAHNLQFTRFIPANLGYLVTLHEENADYKKPDPAIC